MNKLLLLRRSLRLSALFLIIAPRLGHAATPAGNSPAGSSSRPAVGGHAKLFDPAMLSERTLPNGVRGIVRETRGTDLVSVQVWVRAGSRYEADANNGVSHLIESLAMRASQHYPRAPLSGIGGGAADAINGLGGVAGSLTSRDATFYSATVAAQFLPAAVRALADATLHPKLTDADVESAKAEVEDDLARRAQDPLVAASDIAYRTAFTRHPYRKPAGGTQDSLEGLTGAIVRSYYQAHYAGANISVVIVGDTQRAAAYSLIDRYFSVAPTASTLPPRIAPEQAPKTFKSVSHPIGDSGTTLALAFRAPGITTPQDAVAMDVLLSYWKEGSAATLRQVLLGDAKPTDEAVNENGNATGGDQANGAAPNSGKAPLAIAFDVDFLTQHDPGLFLVSLRVDPQQRAAALAATLKEFARVRAQGIDAPGLQRAKKILAAQYIQQSETVSGQAGALGFYDMIDSYDFAATYLERVQHVTRADIKRVANRYLGSAYIQITLQPAPSNNMPRLVPPHGGSGVFTARAILDAKTRGQRAAL